MNDQFYSIEDDFDYKDIKFGGKTIQSIINDKKFNFKDFSTYLPLRKKEVSDSNIQMIFLDILKNGTHKNVSIMQ